MRAPAHRGCTRHYLDSGRLPWSGHTQGRDRTLKARVCRARVFQALRAAFAVIRPRGWPRGPDRRYVRLSPCARARPTWLGFTSVTFAGSIAVQK